MQALTTQELRDMIAEDGDLEVINVLPKESFEQAHIPGSDNIPVDQEDFVDQVERKLGDKSKPVVVYCANLDCEASPRAARKLDESGFKNVYDYTGGTKEWSRAGYDLAAGA